MKNLPIRSMDEIYTEFHVARGGPSLEEIRRTHAGSGRQEIAWAIANMATIMKKEGWAYSAIARFFHRNHATIMYHEKREHGQNPTS